jgi:DNA-binding NtrC family response regulator
LALVAGCIVSVARRIKILEVAMRSVLAKVLIAIPDAKLRMEVKRLFQDQAFSIVEASGVADVVSMISRHHVEVMIVASPWDDTEDALSLVHLIRSRERTLSIILLVRESSESLAIAALKAGVDDYFTPPWRWEEIRTSVELNLASSRDRVLSDRSAIDPDKEVETTRSMIGASSAIQAVTEHLIKVARTDISVLITGETGTGKELAAELTHANSPRRKHAFICVNCAAIPDPLFESELFGYERGAFTGAFARKEGHLKQADKGTVFFDEIGDMSHYAQAKLLRAIESREVYRIGGQEPVPVDVRIIAATNRDLERSVSEGTFRKDLYFRVNVARIQLPPLRDRKDDIILLADHFRRGMNARFHRDVEGFEEDVLDAFLRYNWPGNVRELKNVMEATYVDLTSRRIAVPDLPQHVRERLMAMETAPQHERDRLLAALVATNWNMSKAAQRLHWSRMTLYRKTAKYHISRRGIQRAAHETRTPWPASHV